ncbi:MAG: hypothetical protein HQ477_07910 [Chloroflexi bacterium]|nr:hypothetical protein [Chloroflexota bacterium]
MIALERPEFASYLYYMIERLRACHKVLKRTGSLYLHCDYRAAPYLRMALDEQSLFGAENFRSEITWQRTNIHNDAKNWCAVTDTILYYVKDSTSDYTWNPQRGEHTEEYLSSKYRFDDNDGRGLYRLDNMTSPSPRPHMMYEWRGHASPPKGWRYEQATMKRLDSDGRIWYPDSLTKRPQLKRYYRDIERPLNTNIWTDINPINSQAKERVGYPTQKPKELLKRIILASSKEGQVVLDPFCGCGTAIFAAQEAKRDWIGIDINKTAYEMTRGRHTQLPLGMQSSLAEAGYIPRDLDELEQMNGQAFEAWVNEFYRAEKPFPDAGVDGITPDGIPIQTKTYEIRYDVIGQLLTDARHHRAVPQPLRKIRLVSRTGFDDSARSRAFEIETAEEIEVELVTPKDMLSLLGSTH